MFSHDTKGLVAWMTTIMIADDSQVMREGLSTLLGTHPGFEVVGTANDGAEAIERAKALVPDVIIMDVQMPKVDGLEATRTIKQLMPSIHIVVLSVFSDYLEDCIAAGADCFMTKDCDPDDLIAQVLEIIASY
jgi:two-component system NarL family response regulator